MNSNLTPPLHSNSDRYKQEYKLDLLDEYQNPVPFPEDKFIELDLPSDQFYVMFSSAMTGNQESP